MRFGLKSIVVLAVLYRAILVSQGGSGTAALSSDLTDAVPTAQARIRDEIVARIGTYCRSDPTTCLSGATQITGLVASRAASDPAEPRHLRHGAIAAAAR